MSPRDFVKKSVNKKQLDKAVRQQKQIQYLTVSSVQEDLRYEFLETLAESKYSGGDDPMLQWVYAIFKTDNFKSFYKYLRFPVASSRVVKEEVEKSLRRVFFSDDAFRKYIVRGKEVDCPEYLEYDDFLNTAFESILYSYNDIVIHDLKDVNFPVRELVCIDKVVSMRVEANRICKIAYRAKYEIDEKDIEGCVYLDEYMFAFVPDDENIAVIEVPHDIQVCPASFVSPSAFDKSEPIVRESLFSRVRPLMEEYVFLKTLQLMSDPNGAIPIVVKLAADQKNQDENDQNDELPMSSAGIRGHAEKPSDGSLQAGSIHTVEPFQKPDGSFDTEITKNYITFFRTPVESLEYINKRIEATRKTIVETLVGDFVEQSEESKNELQVSKSYLLKQDKLRVVAHWLGYCVNESDSIMLKLANGKDSYVEGSFGTDFFIETQDELYERIQIAPNPIERGNILNRLTRIRGFNSVERENRDKILYQIIPFVTSSDFDRAINQGIVTSADILLQTKFHYFIAIFERKYGSVESFWEDLGDVTSSEKLILTKNLLNQIIKDYESENNSSYQNNPIPAGSGAGGIGKKRSN